MNIKPLLLGVLLPLVLTANTSAVVAWPEAKITVQIVGDDGMPVERASVHIGFESVSDKPDRRDGISDKNGIFEITAKTSFRIFTRVTKSDYYPSDAVYEYKLDQLNGPKVMPRKWNPYEAKINVLLRKITKPIPMYAKHVELKIAKDGEPLGFDLLEGDWVAPYGKGKTADFIFTSIRAIKDPKQWEAGLSLTFPNQGDGIQDAFAPLNYGSDLHLPHQAPVGGYKSDWSQASSSTRYANPRTNQNYFFRVRTVLDDKGNVKSALYGKIYGDIGYYAGVEAPRAGLGFTYYLNPIANDPNVEFDPKQNLFRGPSEFEQVNKP